ncbi:acetyltransferase [Halomonas sp. HAL1]|uniref:acetyltransferase n=1 Tax=Halomonas sp. HAL1 TaxID=550984 RepID=UPI00022D2BC3|nr:acetyltransferase [Halomonas sp. HAL1]EHA14334.1 pilin glycosylation protein [Halomonas sp. HAL1]WKV92407.1 acetyltransferase [Halomonas sp. HAL1]
MSDRKRLAIFGASGHGKVVADIALLSGWQEIDFYDDAWPEKKTLAHWILKGAFIDLIKVLDSYDGVIVAIGNNAIRETMTVKIKTLQGRLATLIHPQAIVSPFANIEEGVVVVGGAVINAFATLGLGCIVNTGATVGHDCHISSCVHIAPGANVAGNVTIGRNCWVGVGAAIRQGIQLQENVVVGAGAAVVQDVECGQTVIGVPARSVSQ